MHFSRDCSPKQKVVGGCHHDRVGCRIPGLHKHVDSVCIITLLARSARDKSALQVCLGFFVPLIHEQTFMNLGLNKSAVNTDLVYLCKTCPYFRPVEKWTIQRLRPWTLVQTNASCWSQISTMAGLRETGQRRFRRATLRSSVRAV